jgi:hypothetical protein
VARISYQLESHVADAIAEGLQRRDIPVVTAQEAGIRNLPDDEIVRRCDEQKRVVVTNDQDFLRLHGAGNAHAGIVYWQQQTKGIGQILQGLALIYEVMSAEEMRGRVEFI